MNTCVVSWRQPLWRTWPLRLSTTGSWISSYRIVLSSADRQTNDLVRRVNDRPRLLLLRSQLYLWGSPFLCKIFAYVTVFLLNIFFNATIEVVAFRLRGWWMLGVFLLLALTHPWYERQDLLSPCAWWNACVHRLDLRLYSHPKEFLGNGVRTHVFFPGKIRSTGGSAKGGTRASASRTTGSPTHYRLSYSGPHRPRLIGWISW